MTQESLPWSGTTIGDATQAPYDDDEWSDAWRYMFLDNRDASGIIRGYANELEVTGIVTPISVDTGAAVVDGKVYTNDAAVQFVIATPGANPRIDRIVLRKSWAAQTVRLTLVAGAEGASPSPPVITHSDGVTWDIPIAQVFIDTVGNIICTMDNHWANAAIDSPIFVNDGRITLVLGEPIQEVDQNTFTPASTSAINDTVTFAATPGWETGQGVQCSATVNGLTINTEYFVRTTDGLTYSFHDIVYDALNNVNKVNLTGNIEPNTLHSSRIYYEEFIGDEISLFTTDYGWGKFRIIDRLGVNFISAAATTPRDIFAYYDATNDVIALETLVWTNDTTRATDLVRQNGRLVKSGDATRLYIGSIRTDGTVGHVVDVGGGASISIERYVWNQYNRIPYTDWSYDTTDSWVENNVNWHAMNGGNAAWLAKVLVGWDDYDTVVEVHPMMLAAAANCYVAIGLDSVTPSNVYGAWRWMNSATIWDNAIVKVTASLLGYHTFQGTTKGQAAGNYNMRGDLGGVSGDIQRGLFLSGWR